MPCVAKFSGTIVKRNVSENTLPALKISGGNLLVIWKSESLQCETVHLHCIWD